MPDTMKPNEPETEVEVELDKDDKDAPVDEVAKPPKSKKAKAPAPTASQPLSYQAEQSPSVGRIVHFCIPKAMHGGDDPVHRPAIVSNVRNAKKGIVDLHVFVTKDDYPGNYHPGPLMTADKVGYSESEEDGTWHWPERV
jgi:hypothetical protein